MDNRMRFPGKTPTIAGAVLAGLIGVTLFASCAKEQPQPQSKQTPTSEHVAVDQTQVKPVAVAQTTCPVMGGAINKDVFVEYKGQKVYFCCKGCPETFLANPEKYVAKLPQFQD